MFAGSVRVGRRSWLAVLTILIAVIACAAAAPVGALSPATPAATAGPVKPHALVLPPGAFIPLLSARILDTRSGPGAVGPVGAGQTVVVQVAGRAGVPAGGVASVAVTLTVVSPTAGGYITAYADGAARPNASNVNFQRAQTVPNMAVIPVGADGRIRLYNGSPGTVQLLGDVSGYVRSGAAALPGMFRSLVPQRLLDTRSRNGAIGPVARGGTVVLQAAGRGGLPTGNIGAVAVNLTVTGPTAGGYITAYADGSARPTTSNVNFDRGRTVANLAIVPVGADGRIRLYNGSAGALQLLGDVSGYVIGGTPTVPGAFQRTGPVRLLDTRSHNGAAGPIGPGQTVRLTIGGRGGIPADDVAAVAINLTVTGPTSGGYLSAYPGSDRPTASSVNFLRAQTVANEAIVPVDADGTITVFNGSSGTIQVLGDVSGYFLGLPYASVRGFAYFLDSASAGHPNGQRVTGITTEFHLFEKYSYVNTDATGAYALDLDERTYNVTCITGSFDYECGPEGGDGGPFPLTVPPDGQTLNFVVCLAAYYPACLRH